MLTEQQLDVIGHSLEPLFNQLEREMIELIVKDIKRTIIKINAELPYHRVEELLRLGYSRDAVEAQLLTEFNTSQLPKIIDDTSDKIENIFKSKANKILSDVLKQNQNIIEFIAAEAFANDVQKAGADIFNPDYLKQIADNFKGLVESDMRKMVGNASLTTSTGTALVKDVYKKQIDYALLKIVSGTSSLQQVANESAKKLSDAGLETIEYISGRKSHIQDASRRTLQTQAGKMSGEITTAIAKDLGLNLVEVTSHWGARDKGVGVENHASWQGKVYCLEPQEGYITLREATGYPDDPRGLKGYNCRHDFYPFVEGSDRSKIDPEPEAKTVEYRGQQKKYTYYEATQQQRAFESRIRQLKRNQYALVAAGDKSAAAGLNQTIKILTKEYRTFSDAVGISAKLNRLAV